MKAKTCTSVESQIRATDDKTVAPRLLDLRSAAAYLSLSYWSVRRMVLSGEIDHLRFGKKILVDVEDVNRWIGRRKERGVY